MRSPVQFDVYIVKFLALYCALRTRDEQTQTEKKKKRNKIGGNVHIHASKYIRCNGKHVKTVNCEFVNFQMEKKRLARRLVSF